LVELDGECDEETGAEAATKASFDTVFTRRVLRLDQSSARSLEEEEEVDDDLGRCTSSAHGYTLPSLISLRSAVGELVLALEDVGKVDARGICSG